MHCLLGILKFFLGVCTYTSQGVAVSALNAFLRFFVCFSQVDFDEFVEMMKKICDVKVRN